MVSKGTVPRNKETNVQQETIEEQNLALMRKFYEARARRDLDAVAECLADDAVWRYPGRNPFAREYRGKEDIAQNFFGRLPQVAPDFRTEAHRIMVNGDVAAVYELPHGTRNGQTLDWDALLLFHIRDGKIAEGKVFQHIQYELDEWWN